MVGKVKNFFLEVVVELKKVSWPTKQELKEATYVVIVSSICLGFFIGLTDLALSKFISLLF